MKMKFWQKAYILILLLFLLCLNTGIAALLLFTYDRQISSEERTAQIELLLLAESFEREYNALDESVKGESALILMEGYGDYYSTYDSSLLFTEGGEILYSSFNGEVNRPAAGNMAIRTVGTRHILVSYDLCGGRYTLTYGKNIDSIDQAFKSMLTALLLTDLAVSLILAIALFLLLRRLVQPLEKLKKTTEIIAAGNYDCTVEQKGHDEFAALAESFNAMVGQIRTQMQSLELSAEQNQMLVDNMAHELRTPMTSIRGYAEYIMEAPLNEQEKIEAAETILGESERLQRISEKLLDSAFIRNNEINRTSVTAEPILRSVCEKLRAKAAEKGVSIDLLDPSANGAVVISGDEVLLDLLVYNLADNAIKACSEGGSVLLVSQVLDASAILMVIDNGKGMTDEQIKHITEPFYRTDKSRSRADGGAGLGLSLCRRIVDAHGGQMSFQSEVGKGTTVTVRLEEARIMN